MKSEKSPRISRILCLALIALSGLALSACASQIMKSFVGRDVASVIARYGPYENTFNMPDGRRAFQWKMVETSMIPFESTVDEVMTRNGSSERVRSSGGYWNEETCFYTVYALPSGENDWTIVGYEKPDFDCE